MARKDFLKTNADNLTEAVKQLPKAGKRDLRVLVDSYIKNKDIEKKYKDLASAENTEIKAVMQELKLDKYEANTGSVTLSERVTEDFVEDKLIEFLKGRGIADGIVKSKEYVDFDALESAIYHEKISGDNLKDMAECKEKKVTQVLRIKKKGD